MTDPENTSGGATPDSVLAAEYVLGLLGPEELEAFEARLNTEEDLVIEVARWAEHFAAMVDRLPEATPPGRVKRAIDTRLFGEDERKSLFGWLWPYAVGGIAAAMLAFVAIDTGLVDMPGQVADGPVYRADLEPADPVAANVSLSAVFDAGRGVLEVAQVQGLAPDGRDHELWLIVGENAPVSLGVLPDDGVAVISWPDALPRDVDGALFAVSEEPDGGSQTGAPTGPIRAVGSITLS